MDTNPKPTERTIYTARPTTTRYTPRYRPLLTILFLLCIPIFIYQLIPTFTHTTDTAIDALLSKIRTPASFCTKDIGDAHCCELYLAAAPCQDECRNRHVDRETLVLTAQYDDCASGCLASYEKICGK
jgi:hypothetical protein